MFSKMQLFLKSWWRSTVSSPSQQRLKVLVLPSVAALSLWWKAASSFRF